MILSVCRPRVSGRLGSRWSKTKRYRLLMGVLEEFGRNVRREREKVGLSQEKLAEKAGLHRTYIGMIERGERNVTLRKAKKIADSLDINLSDLIPK